MVSHTPAGELILLSVEVLILIVMDNGLSLRGLVPNTNTCGVLILIVMDNGLSRH